MKVRTLGTVIFLCFSVWTMWLCTQDTAQALPSYARQTNLSCNACHIVFPELNSFGRRFKLHGYTMVSADTIDYKNSLQLLKSLPISVMGQISLTNLKEEQPGTQNNNFAFPQQLSVFLSGALGRRLGSFIQVTYDDQDGTFGWDNTDIRFADQTVLGSKDLVYGVTVNNNPTVQDVWNSTPAWGVPYAMSDSAPTPSAAALIDGGLAQNVIGFSGYGFYNQMIYGEFGVYRSAGQGSTQPPDQTSSGIIKGVSPYWRVALQHQWSNQYLEFGTYGISSEIYPQGVSGPVNRYTDTAIDSEYHRNVGGNGDVVLHATWIHENQQLDAFFASGDSQNASNTLNTVRFDGSFYFKNRVGPTFGYFSTTGTRDDILYSPAEIVGSRTGKPNSDGIILQLSYFPLLNARLSAQYVAYFNYNGSDTNYDGFGRDSSDNNTFYALGWILF